MKKSLKTLAAVVIAALTFGLTACTKDADDLIIGSWEMTSMTLSIDSSDAPEDSWSNTWTPEQGESTVWTFNKDNTVTVTDTENGETTTENGTYSVKDNTLTMTVDSETEILNIDNIDKKSMTLSISESNTEEGTTHTESLVINFTKK